MSSGAQIQVYVTFSGETSKVQNPILTVVAIAVGATTGTTLGAVTVDLQEPRGMAVDAQNRLYVAQSYKKATAILVFPPLGGNTPISGTELVVQAAQPPSAPPPLQSAPLLHPYGLAFDGAGNLYQSSQDTNVVSGYALSVNGGTVSAAALPTSPALAGIANGVFYPGQYVMTFVPLATNPGITLVPQTSGGLDYVESGSAHSVRGIAVAGDTLYVVDEAAALVGTYALPGGEFTGWITTVGSGVTPAMSAPVGIAVDSAGNVYVGDSGSNAIYKWVPRSGSTPGALSVFAGGDAFPEDFRAGRPAGRIADLREPRSREGRR